MTIYRSLRFGRHVELVLTDQRSYRSDHAIPEEFSDSSIEYLDPRNVLPTADLAIMDAGMTANGGNPPATVGTQRPAQHPPDQPARHHAGQGAEDLVQGHDAVVDRDVEAVGQRGPAHALPRQAASRWAA